MEFLWQLPVNLLFLKKTTTEKPSCVCQWGCGPWHGAPFNVHLTDILVIECNSVLDVMNYKEYFSSFCLILGTEIPSMGRKGHSSRSQSVIGCMLTMLWTPCKEYYSSFCLILVIKIAGMCRIERSYWFLGHRSRSQLVI